MGSGFACPRMPGQRLATMEPQNCSEPCPSYRPVWTAERSAWILCNSDGGGRKVDTLLQLCGLFRLPLRNTAASGKAPDKTGGAGSAACLPDTFTR